MDTFNNLLNKFFPLNNVKNTAAFNEGLNINSPDILERNQNLSTFSVLMKLSTYKHEYNKETGSLKTLLRV